MTVIANVLTYIKNGRHYIPRLTYIRTLPNRNMLTVTYVAISETLCDVATVHDMASSNPTASPAANYAGDVAGDVAGDATGDVDTEAYEKDAAYKYKSLLRVHTVNAKFVGEN